MSSLLGSYLQQYSVLTAEITSKTGLVSGLDGSDKKDMVHKVEKLLEEANELLEQMELEIRDIPSDNRVKYNNQVKSYKAELIQMNKELRRAKVRYSDERKDRDELFSDDIHSTEDQRVALLDNTEKLERSSRKLESGYKMSVETEQIGSEILDNLYSQRQTISRARDRLKDTDNELHKSSRILSSMTRRIIQNKLLLYGISLFMVIVIIVVIYFSVTKKS